MNTFIKWKQTHKENKLVVTTGNSIERREER